MEDVTYINNDKSTMLGAAQLQWLVVKLVVIVIKARCVSTLKPSELG